MSLTILPNDSVFVQRPDGTIVHVDGELRRVRVREARAGAELGGRTTEAYPFAQVIRIELIVDGAGRFDVGLHVDSGKTLEFGCALHSTQARWLADALESLVGCRVIEVAPPPSSSDFDHLEAPTLRLGLR